MYVLLPKVLFAKSFPGSGSEQSRGVSVTLVVILWLAGWKYLDPLAFFLQSAEQITSAIHSQLGVS